MLDVLLARALAGVILAAIVAGFLLGHSITGWSHQTVRVVKAGGARRWTQVLWVAGSLTAAFWSIGVLLAPSFAYDWPRLPGFPFSTFVQALGFSISILGGLLFFTAARALGPHMTPAIQLREGHRLVETGPYRYVRHPVYTAILTGAAGGTLLYLSLPLALVALVLLVLASYRAALEEKLLGSPEGFGETYARYVARTARFLPRFRPKGRCRAS